MKENKISSDQIYDRERLIRCMIFRNFKDIPIQDVNDIVQDVYVNIIKYGAEEVNTSYISNVVFKCVDRYRRRNYGQRYTRSVDPSSYMMQSLEHKMPPDMRQLNELVEALETNDMIIMKRYMDGYTDQEIADTIGYTRPAVTRRRNQLFKILSDQKQADDNE